MSGDPSSLRRDAPLLDGWLRYRSERPSAWTTPGHKGRTDLVGDVVAGDLPLYGGVDTIRSRHGRLDEAERRLAALWGADWARISVGGSTHGNQALCLAVARPGDKVVVNRNLHRSMLIGLVLAGLVPVWVTPDVEPTVGLPVGVPVDRVRRALDQHPDCTAVFLV
ncbi:MAG: decarboxylase, partial [Actinomycetes bacterium]